MAQDGAHVIDRWYGRIIAWRGEILQAKGVAAAELGARVEKARAIEYVCYTLYLLAHNSHSYGFSENGACAIPPSCYSGRPSSSFIHSFQAQPSSDSDTSSLHSSCRNLPVTVTPHCKPGPASKTVPHPPQSQSQQQPVASGSGSNTTTTPAVRERKQTQPFSLTSV